MNIVDVIRSLAGFAWLAAIGLGVLAIARASRNQKVGGINSTVVLVVVLAIVLSALGAGLVFLQANQYAVVRSAFQPNGYRPQPLGPGLHWIVPIC